MLFLPIQFFATSLFLSEPPKKAAHRTFTEDQRLEAGSGFVHTIRTTSSVTAGNRWRQQTGSPDDVEVHNRGARHLNTSCTVPTPGAARQSISVPTVLVFGVLVRDGLLHHRRQVPGVLLQPRFCCKSVEERWKNLNLGTPWRPFFHWPITGSLYPLA